MGISLDMPKSPKDSNFTVHLTLLGLWNQELPSFLKITLSMGVIYLGTLFLRKIIENLPHQVTDWLSLTIIPHIQLGVEQPIAKVS